MSDLIYDEAKLAEGEAFTLLLPDGRQFGLTLTTVERRATLGAWPEGLRVPFKMWFRSAPGQSCPQGAYLFRNARLGDQTIFIVPIGHDRDTDTYRYEAIFN